VPWGCELFVLRRCELFVPQRCELFVPQGCELFVLRRCKLFGVRIICAAEVRSFFAIGNETLQLL
jgi:hypothetical protein